jgi:aldehyde dehydrogenase (NAD+)
MTDTAIQPARGVYIDGAWRPPHSGKTLPVVSPPTGQVFAEIAAGDGRDINDAVMAARAAFDKGPWGPHDGHRTRPPADEARPPHRGARRGIGAGRGARLRQADAAGARATSPPARATSSIYGGAADKLHGETIPYMEGYTSLTIWREPLGVTGHIIPWNYPAQMVGRTSAPALAAGNACVCKPAEDACLVPLMRIGELAAEVGLPRRRHQCRARSRP